MGKKEKSMQKIIAIHFKYANVFVFKSICKYCKTGPSSAYFVMNKDLSQDNFQFLLKREPTNDDFIITDGDMIASLISSRVFKPYYMFDRNAAVERSVFVPNSKFEPSRDEISCKMECDCGKTTWSFTNSRRKHIHNRKGQKFIPLPRS